MKTIDILNNVVRCRATVIAVIPAFICSPLFMKAQLPVTNVYTHTANATTTTTYSGTGATGNASSGFAGNTYTYKFGLNVAASNNITIVDSVKANLLNYHYEPTTSLVKFRRVDGIVTGLRKSLRIEQTGGSIGAGGTVSCYPDYNDSLEQVFSQRIFNVGIDNVFQNATTTNNINIERMDVIFPYGVKATNSNMAGFVVFDWGNVGGHDPFYIAAIKTLDASGNPSSYYPAVNVAAGNYGSGVGGNSTYVIMRRNAGENRLLLMNNSTTQNRDGVFFRFSDLGVPASTAIFGYSVFGPDVTVLPTSNLVDYTNAANFPTGSDLGGGGLDPLAVTGLWVVNATNIVLADRVNDLSATLVNDQVKLNWNLQNTGDLKEQVVERSNDGVSYSDIVHMPVQTTGIQTALDSRPLNGMNYYRLKLIQQDGSVAAYSSAGRIDLKTSDASAMDVYPNPVKNKMVNVNIRTLTGSGRLLLLNMNGQIVMQQSVIGEQSMQTTLHLPNMISIGTYVLQLIDNAGNKISERQIIVE
jgi:hypothetical protein